MALNPSTLQSGFLQLFTTNKPQTPQQAAEMMASIYDSYAQTAMAGPALPIFPGTGKLALQNLLLPAIATPLVSVPPLLAAAWGAGLLAYWNAPPVPFVGPAVAGAVAVAAGVSLCIPLLTACYVNPANTAQSAAAQMASALDAATRTVIVAIVPPPGTTVPLV
jgi:hypothetical protein